MTSLLLQKGRFPKALLQPTIDYVLRQQFEDGCIPWYRGDKADPWDHTEAAMGLSIAGEYAAAEHAYQWLADRQLADGSWWNHYINNEPVARDRRETNFVAYVATGIWHHYLITQDITFLRNYFAMVSHAIDFVLGYQTEHGEVSWAVDENGKGFDDALLTANCSIAKSIECAINIAVMLGECTDRWRAARDKLLHCLRHKPGRFDRNWESKARYSMDWFYPVLCGVITGDAARAHIDARWHEFVELDLGCRCVADEPWVTIAESCELTLALLAIGDHARAVNLYSWLHQFLDTDGGYWMGYVFRDKAIWPEEKTTWTSGAILLAADALTEHTAAAKLFTQSTVLADRKALKAPRRRSQTAQNAQGIDRRQRLK